MNKYESVIILDPDIQEDSIKEAINEIQDTIKKFDERNENESKTEDLGKKKLAYQVRGKDSGIYVLFTFYAKAEDITELERIYRKTDEVLKFISVRLDGDDNE